MEKEKLLGWAVLAKISDVDEKMAGSGVRLHRHTVIDTLREIQVLLLDSSQLRKRYNLDLPPVPSKAQYAAVNNMIFCEDYKLREIGKLREIDFKRPGPR